MSTIIGAAYRVTEDIQLDYRVDAEAPYRTSLAVPKGAEWRAISCEGPLFCFQFLKMGLLPKNTIPLYLDEASFSSLVHYSTLREESNMNFETTKDFTADMARNAMRTNKQQEIMQIITRLISGIKEQIKRNFTYLHDSVENEYVEEVVNHFRERKFNVEVKKNPPIWNITIDWKEEAMDRKSYDQALTEDADDLTSDSTPCCASYLDGIEQINNAFMLSTLHHGAPYTAPPFRFCPWCGKKVKQQTKETPAETDLRCAPAIGDLVQRYVDEIAEFQRQYDAVPSYTTNPLDCLCGEFNPRIQAQLEELALWVPSTEYDVEWIDDSARKSPKEKRFTLKQYLDALDHVNDVQDDASINHYVPQTAPLGGLDETEFPPQKTYLWRQGTAYWGDCKVRVSEFRTLKKRVCRIVTPMDTTPWPPFVVMAPALEMPTSMSVNMPKTISSITTSTNTFTYVK